MCRPKVGRLEVFCFQRSPPVNRKVTTGFTDGSWCLPKKPWCTLEVAAQDAAGPGLGQGSGVIAEQSRKGAYPEANGGPVVAAHSAPSP